VQRTFKREQKRLQINKLKKKRKKRKKDRSKLDFLHGGESFVINIRFQIVGPLYSAKESFVIDISSRFSAPAVLGHHSVFEQHLNSKGHSLRNLLETFSYTKGIVFKYFAKIGGRGGRAWSILKIQYGSVRIWCNPREARLQKKKTWALGLYEMWKAQYSIARITRKVQFS